MFVSKTIIDNLLKNNKELIGLIEKQNVQIGRLLSVCEKNQQNFEMLHLVLELRKTQEKPKE